MRRTLVGRPNKSRRPRWWTTWPAVLVVLALALWIPISVQAQPDWPQSHHAAPGTATGWQDADDTRTDDTRAASTTTDGQTLTLTDFDAGPTGDIHRFTLLVRGEDPSGGESALAVAARSDACNGIQTSMDSITLSDLTTHIIDLSCPDAWSWDALAGMTVELTPQASNAALGLIGAGGSWRVEHAWVDASYTNAAPIVDAGGDLSVEEGSLVQLIGSATDPEGDPITYQWTQVSGRDVLETPDGPQWGFVAPGIATAAAESTFRLTVTDSYGNQGVDQVTITITDTDPSAPGTDPLVPEGSAPIQAEVTTDPATGFATCSAPLPAAGADETASVLFPRSCGMDALLVAWDDAHGAGTLTMEQSDAPRTGSPEPTWDADAVAYSLRYDGLPEPTSLTVRVHVAPEVLVAVCDAPDCRATLFAVKDGDWDILSQLDGGDKLTAESPSTDQVILAGTTQVAGPFMQWWIIVLVAVALVGGGTAGALISRRFRQDDGDRPPTADELQNEELLQFLNNASHDLASPLTPIRLQLHMLTEMDPDSMDDKQRRALDVVRRNVEQMGLLVQDLKEASRLQAGKMELFPEDIDIQKVAHDAADSFKEPAEEQGVTLEFRGDKALPVHGDAGRLNQVIYNLLTNAIKFTPEGGTVSVEATADDDEAVVRVTDSGIGLDQEDMDRLFQPFAQVHGAKERKKGSGLGLYISQGIVQAHDGRIWIESDGPGTGSTFSFAIPLRDD